MDSKNQGWIQPLLREVVESIDGGVLVLDSQGSVLVANREFKEMWRISKDILPTAEADPFLEFVAAQVEDPAAYFALVGEKFRNSEPEREDLVELKDGRTFIRHVKPFKIIASVEGFILTFRDITVQRQMERELLRKTAFLEALCESTMEGILVVDNAGQKLMTNQQFVNTWKLPQEVIDDADNRVQLKFVVSLVKEPEQFMERIRYLYAHPEERSRDQIEFLSGSTLDRYSAPVVGRDGAQYGRIWSFRDVTDLVEARKAAEAASQAKGQFLANTSHEIRTPLNGIIGLTSILLENNLDAESRDIVSTIQASGATLLRIINDVLDFSRIEAGAFEIEPKPTNLEELCNDVVALYKRDASEHGIALQVVPRGERDPQIENILLDPVRIRQVLSNLVSNAVKFTHRGGVTLEWGFESRGLQKVVSLCVSDTGIGIPPDRLDAVFESFTQADSGIHGKYGGTGLGLAISKKLIELMDGKMWVTSQQGFGSKFWVELPLDIARPIKKTPEALCGSGDRSFQGYRILLAEDNAVNVKVARTMLSRRGCTVDVAENGMVAFSKVQVADYDLVLMDMMMPVCNGLEATRLIRSWEKSRGRSPLPIIALTANGFQDDRDLCLTAGMNDFLTKPFTVDQLRSALYKWLPRTREEDDAA